MTQEQLQNVARAYIGASLGYQFTENERRIAAPFFTNLDRRVFFMHTLPASVGSTLLAMYSRMKNPRGLRGVFVDSFIPQFLATQLSSFSQEYEGKEDKFLKDRNITSLDTFIGHNDEAKKLFDEFLKRCTIDPEYLKLLGQSSKAQNFLSTWLGEKFGHNSIARTGSLWLCCEKISALTAKTLEWSRPGAGYIELSTRYVEMSGAGCYPVEAELEQYGVDPALVTKARDNAFTAYATLAGEKNDGPFPQFLRESYANAYKDSPKDLESGVFGESCDVLGNLLPSSVLTSVGMCVSGESFAQVLAHLLLDATPENIALAEQILSESQQVGAKEFAKFYEPTAWTREHWQYLGTERFMDLAEVGMAQALPLVSYGREEIEQVLGASLSMRPGLSADLSQILSSGGFKNDRSRFDKLPAEFEGYSVAFRGLMTFRGWRDLHRMGFCTHLRTPVTTKLGFYQYDKLAFGPLQEAFERISQEQVTLEKVMEEKGVPAILRQYPLSLGWNIGFTVGANLRQWEFCNWQRSKPSVNHEVRQVFLSVENYLRQLLPWWAEVSRADVTPAYAFARGMLAVPITLEKEKAAA